MSLSSSMALLCAGGGRGVAVVVVAAYVGASVVMAMAMAMSMAMVAVVVVVGAAPPLHRPSSFGILEHVGSSSMALLAARPLACTCLAIALLHAYMAMQYVTICVNVYGCT